MRKKRLVTVAEVGPDDRLDVELFKSITSGGDAVALRTFFDKSGGEDAVFSFALAMSGNEPYGPPPKEAAAFARLEVLSCTHVVAEGARSTAEELAIVDPEQTGEAWLAFFAAGFTRLYGAKGGVIQGPESSVVAKQALMDALNPWTRVIETLFEVTGDERDGVLKAEAWEEAKREYDGGRRLTSRDKDQFEAEVQRRGVRAMRSHVRWGNRHLWAGMKWSADVTEETGDFARPVTLPDW